MLTTLSPIASVSTHVERVATKTDVATKQLEATTSAIVEVSQPPPDPPTQGNPPTAPPESSGRASRSEIPHLADMIAARWGAPWRRFLRVSSDSLSQLLVSISEQSSGITTWSAGTQRVQIASLGRGSAWDSRHVARLRVTDAEPADSQAVAEFPPEVGFDVAAGGAPEGGLPGAAPAALAEVPAPELSSLQGAAGPSGTGPAPEVPVAIGQLAAARVQQAGEQVSFGNTWGSSGPSVTGSLVDVLG